jgi:peptidoglycan hydrolase-like protein with peptidoglycan-binding domain
VQESSVRLSVSEVSRRFARARAQETMTSSGGDQSEISQTQCPSGQRITQNLRLGDQGQQVQLLQGHINRILEEYYDQAVGPIDGIFGPLTQQGVELLQEALAQEQGADLGTAGIDGIVGPFTREAINNSC